VAWLSGIMYSRLRVVFYWHHVNLSMATFDC
jgi:hypothetical protein